MKSQLNIQYLKTEVLRTEEFYGRTIEIIIMHLFLTFGLKDNIKIQVFVISMKFLLFYKFKNVNAFVVVKFSLL